VTIPADDLRRYSSPADPAFVDDLTEHLMPRPTSPRKRGERRRRRAGETEKPPSQASQLVALARGRYDLFMSQDGRPYAVPKDGPNVALPLRGRAGLRSRLAREYADESGGTVPSQAALADAMTVLEGIAASAPPRTLYLRVARHDSSIVVDLGTPDGRCVIIGPHGWDIAPRSPVIFRRSGAMSPLPAPIRGGNGLARLGALLNCSIEQLRVLIGWLVAGFIPDIPHPILVFRGEQGTAKSTAARAVIGLLDPSGAPARTAPRDLKAWAVNAFNSWALCLDNVSYIPDWLSDALCRAVTGDGLIDRALYTDDDVVVLAFRRVVAMTTIDAGALAGDLAERLLTIELAQIPDHKRREEAEIHAAYAEAHPYILGDLFDLLAAVLKTLPDVDLAERPRMADFARVLAAVDAVQGWATLGTYRATARDAVADVLEGDAFAQAVVALVDSAYPAELCLTAQQILDQVDAPEKVPKRWPRDATRAGGQLRRLAPVLRTIGIEVDDSQRQPSGNRSRIYRLTVVGDRRAALERRRNAAPAAPTAPDTQPDQGKRAGADRGHSTRESTRSARGNARAGAAGADAGAGDSVAPAPCAGPDQGKHPAAGAVGGAGAGMHPLSNVAVTLGSCARCGTRCRRYGDHGRPLCDACRGDQQ